ncbi:hypothetical protein V6N13_120152 [Hibiscus sabdariffa]
MNASATVAVGSCLSISKPLSIGLTPVPICLPRRRRRRCLMIEADVELAASEAQSTYRRLILLRHAKSSWQHPALRDHDRPLSKSGRADAVAVSQKLQRMGWIPQLILSSDAVRTRETLQIMQEQVRGFLEAEVHFISSFYSIAAMDGQTAEHLQRTICQYSSDGILTIMCMGHNRGWEEAASMFTGASVELKACNAALLEAPGKSWEEAAAVEIYLDQNMTVPVCRAVLACSYLLLVATSVLGRNTQKPLPNSSHSAQGLICFFLTREVGRFVTMLGKRSAAHLSCGTANL